MYKKLSILLSANSLAMLIPFVALPFLSRLYSPIEFGELAVLMSLSMIIGGLLTLKLENAILIERSKAKIKRLMSTIIIIALLLVILLLIVHFFMIEFLVGYIDSVVFYLSILASISLAFISTINNICLRFSFIKRLALNKFFSSFFVCGFQISLGIFDVKNGLLFGYSLGLIFSLFLYIVVFRMQIIIYINNFSTIFDWRLVINYRDFAIYTTLSLLVNNLARLSPVFYISATYGNMFTGFFQIGSRLTTAPTTIISAAIGDYMKSEMSAHADDFNYIKSVFIKLTFLLAIIAFSSYMVIHSFTSEIVLYVLGEQWTSAIETINILLTIMVFQIIGNPLSSILLIYGYQKVDFLIQLVMLSLFLLVFFLDLDYIGYLKYYVFIMSLTYVFFIIFASWLVLHKKINCG